MANRFDIAYAAHTNSCTFLLDGEGVCRRIVLGQGRKRGGSKTAARCVGARYVASLDPSVPGCLVEHPRVGVPMLFARVDRHGRVALVRSGPVTAFESRRSEDPFFETDDSVLTSAPPAEDLVTTARISYLRAVSEDAAFEDRESGEPAPRPLEAREELIEPGCSTNDDEAFAIELDSSELFTDEHSVPAVALPHATLRDPKVELSPVEDPDDPYARAYALTRERRVCEPPSTRRHMPSVAWEMATNDPRESPVKRLATARGRRG